MNQILHTLWQWINDASNLIAPRRCQICGRRLSSSEQVICLNCFSQIPLTHIQGIRGNKIERLFWEQFPIVRANSWMEYYPQSESSKLLMLLKYGNRPDIGIYLGRIIARDLVNTDFFDGIDAIVPIPLAKDRLRKRGYNQSERIAQGIHAITQIPIDTTSVIRSVSNPTQTHLRAEERRNNVKDIFDVVFPTKIQGKHILLVDDILTTGATLTSCAKELGKIGNTNISILTVGLAGTHFTIDRKKDDEEDNFIF